ncbi:hypothetical protein TanjilG_13745 [Lupinus angustifolius]|uniref:Uncharacterized protein n=1 Tax=Lupinus angustifolius TaxID=3871 RepID=A0A1J7IKA7_LUPAN|nr:hypothetical protein TanjilG_13745 [Lupinus angustifolius]
MVDVVDGGSESDSELDDTCGSDIVIDSTKVASGGHYFDIGDPMNVVIVKFACGIKKGPKNIKLQKIPNFNCVVELAKSNSLG